MTDTKKMTAEDAARIQAHEDRTKSDDGFKERAQRAAAQNATPPAKPTIAPAIQQPRGGRR